MNARHGRWAMLAHIIAMAFLVGGPIYGFTGSIGLTCLAIAAGMFVSCLHFGPREWWEPLPPPPALDDWP
jgi:uncharacterized membrane protein YccC